MSKPPTGRNAASWRTALVQDLAPAVQVVHLGVSSDRGSRSTRNELGSSIACWTPEALLGVRLAVSAGGAIDSVQLLFMLVCLLPVRKKSSQTWEVLRRQQSEGVNRKDCCWVGVPGVPGGFRRFQGGQLAGLPPHALGCCFPAAQGRRGYE